MVFGGGEFERLLAVSLILDCAHDPFYDPNEPSDTATDRGTLPRTPPGLCGFKEVRL